MREWFVNIAGESYASALMWTVAALILLLILLILIRIVRSFTFGTFVAGGKNRRPRLAVTDATAVDSHRRLVLVRRDDVEHLILIGGPSDVVIEQNIREYSTEPAFQAEERTRREPAPVATTPAPAAQPVPREEIRTAPPAPPTPAPTAPLSPSAPTAQSATVVPLKAEVSSPIQPRHETSRPQVISAASAAAATAMPRAAVADDRLDVEIDESVFEQAESETPATALPTASTEMEKSREPAIQTAAPASRKDSSRPEDPAYSEAMLDDIDIRTDDSRESDSKKPSEESLEDEMSRLLEELSDNRR